MRLGSYLDEKSSILLERELSAVKLLVAVGMSVIEF